LLGDVIQGDFTVNYFSIAERFYSMKSILQDASTVKKAINRGWEEAGQPAEFTIKVLDFGEKNFIGFVRRPAIVSITYRLKRLKGSQERMVRRRGEKSVGTGKGVIGSTKDSYGKQSRMENSVGVKKTVGNCLSRRVLPLGKVAQADNGQKQNLDSNEWRAEYVDFVLTRLKELSTVAGFSESFESKVDKQILTVIFDKNVPVSAEEEKLFYASLSYLLMQFLKKKHRKKFQGLQLIFANNSYPSNGRNQT
jgi:predicted RNA-binding protein Jag